MGVMLRLAGLLGLIGLLAWGDAQRPLPPVAHLPVLEGVAPPCNSCDAHHAKLRLKAAARAAGSAERALQEADEGER